VNAARHAERALLGALLLDPAQTDAVATWLRPNDFGIPSHEIAYRLILAAHAGDNPLTPEGVLAAALADDNARRNRVDGPFLHTLIATTPAASRAPLYGRMVLEASIHRAVAYHAGHLAYAAQVAPVEIALQEAAAAQEQLATLEQRWRAVSEGAAEPPGEPAADDTASVRSSDAEALPAETRLVASLLDNPAQLSGIRGWLEPEDIAHPGLRATHAALCHLHTRGDPIDYITVAWEISRAPGDDMRLSPDDLAALARTALPGHAAYAGREVLVHSARRHLRHTAAALEGAAMRPEHGPTRLLAHAHAQLATARAFDERLAVSGTPPPSAGIHRSAAEATDQPTARKNVAGAVRGATP